VSSCIVRERVWIVCGRWGGRGGGGFWGGDVGLFVASLMVVNVVYERDASALRSGVVRRGISSLRGQGLRDWVAEEDKRIEEETKSAGL
jgi:hypothetical protein